MDAKLMNINNKELIKKSIQTIQKLSEKLDEVKIMHVCGSHEHTICKYGIRDVLPDNITVVPGPGCPVCVTTQKEIDKAMYLAEQGHTIATLGDMYRVPGSKKSLMQLQSEGADVKIVYGIGDAVKLAKKQDEKVVFVAIGFETTAPTTAAELLNKPENFYILNSHRQTPPVMGFLLGGGTSLNLDGFICPGHVSTITGLKPYYSPCKTYHAPMVVAGFEPIDVMASIVMILKQLVNGEAKVENEYTRGVKEEGNVIAQKIMNKVFEPADVAWRGFPVIKDGGMKLREEFKKYDVHENIDVPDIKETINKACICSEILRGEKLPHDCKLFGKTCDPMNPVGSCMVSDEGTCRIFYKYSKFR
ncbi:hydrogenase expression/formation protein HypD [Methanococcus maripaludis]|uniref:Hydrogenase expression/formation protein HypD n=1 Tax=Methanococcus maripaludis TaxID=39152 RepID=A0A7J9S4T2_METMI|nr:hydrogenase formation protein HypD [Methanococcus maripaludis]MBB6401801.1 hydrogenase expression/formation protein HypD [Methanococcus maripaludis]